MSDNALTRALLSFGQGASNAVASNVSAPVDGIAWALRKLGVPVPDAPIGGSDWMTQKGLAATPQNKIAGLLGETAGMVAPGLLAAKAPQAARGLLALDDQAMEMARKGVERRMVDSGMIQPATVWHGSPHKFDKFDSSKIGTGEGAQAYGHGMYLAESPAVAGEYRSKLANLAATRDSVGDDVKSAMTMLRAWKDPVKAKEVLTRPNGIYKMTPEQADNALAQASNAGNLYKVDLPDNAISRMLDWDKPLSQQPAEFSALLPDVEKVGSEAAKRIRALAESPGIADWARRDLLSDAASVANSKSPQHVAGVLKRMQLDYGISPDSGVFKDSAGEFLSFVRGMQGVPNMSTGGGAVSYLEGMHGPQKASEMMRSAGIPGIRYLDGGSRGAGAGTSNYVVFPGNEDLLTILERNGVPIK